jgi:peptidoglycan hydrolase-like protein with peptidoglycan-binding domain
MEVKMGIRLVMILVLMAALTGCLKKTLDENAYTEPVVTEETSTADMKDISQEEGTMQGKSVSVEPVSGQTAAFEKPGIQDIQQALKNAGVYEGKIDGISGPKTKNAIEAFQSKAGLKADGKIGPKTWQKLKEYLNKKAK